MKQLESIGEVDSDVVAFLSYCLQIKETITLQDIKDHAFLKDDEFWKSLELHQKENMQYTPVSKMQSYSEFS